MPPSMPDQHKNKKKMLGLIGHMMGFILNENWRKLKYPPKVFIKFFHLRESSQVGNKLFLPPTNSRHKPIASEHNREYSKSFK